MLSFFSHVWLCNPIDPCDPIDPGIESLSPASPALVSGFFTTSATWEAFLRLNSQLTSYTKLWNSDCFVFKAEKQTHMLPLSSSVQHYTRGQSLTWRNKIIGTKKYNEIKNKMNKRNFHEQFYKICKTTARRGKLIYQNHKVILICNNQSAHVCLLSRISCIWFFATLWTAAPQAPLSVGFSSKNTEVGCHRLGSSQPQGSILCLLHLLHWKEGSLPLASPGKPPKNQNIIYIYIYIYIYI